MENETKSKKILHIIGLTLVIIGIVLAITFFILFFSLDQKGKVLPFISGPLILSGAILISIALLGRKK